MRPQLLFLFVVSIAALSTRAADSIKQDFKQIGQDFKKLGQDIGTKGKEIGQDATKFGKKVAHESKEVAHEAKHTGKTIGQRASVAWSEFTTGVSNAWNRVTGKTESKKNDFD